MTGLRLLNGDFGPRRDDLVERAGQMWGLPKGSAGFLAGHATIQARPGHVVPGVGDEQQPGG